MKLSVIIPVYNVENTLDQCVESVLSQGMDDMEVILIDDGSPDGCPQMCDAWAAKDGRVRVIHQDNNGLSEARNRGIDVAQGEYITFTDSDDFLTEGTLLPLIEWMEQHSEVDMLEYSVRSDDARSIMLLLDDKVYETAKDYWLDSRAWDHMYAWNKVFRRKVLSTLRFEKDRLFEDILLMAKVMRTNAAIATTSLGYYNYRYNEKGISKQVDLPTIRQLLRAQLTALCATRTMPWEKNAWGLYRSIACRCYDITRLSFNTQKRKAHT